MVLPHWGVAKQLWLSLLHLKWREELITAAERANPLKRSSVGTSSRSDVQQRKASLRIRCSLNAD